ncbi:hypothetical protein ACFC5X_12395 [Streptomyces sp. NPDC055952]|uniref:hypothetical protein n=1 Tax=Streptomyces sp. NPDC055952 TaxID=3345663 RepID=UPI0035DC5D85
MRERPDGDGVVGETAVEKAKRIDLNVPQVAGAAVAAVLAAKLASYFGVYGTILGAGVVSVVATCGGSLFQHFFTRTGEQIRGATAAAPRVVAAPGAQDPPLPGRFTEGTVYRARVRGWKRPVLAAAVVFGVTMAGITSYELLSGHNLSGGRSTTVGDAVTGGHNSSRAPGDSGKPGESGESEKLNVPETAGSSDAHSEGDTGATADPSAGASRGGDASPAPGGKDGPATPSPTPTPTGSEDSGSGSTAPDASPTPPGPAASSRSGTGGQDRGGPATR